MRVPCRVVCERSEAQGSNPTTHGACAASLDQGHGSSGNGAGGSSGNDNNANIGNSSGESDPHVESSGQA